MDSNGYLGLFDEAGAALGEEQWIAHANENLPPNLSALGTRFVDGSRDQRRLRVSYAPGPSARMGGGQLSGGTIAEMLDQAATHCGSLVTSYACPTLSMNVTILRPGRTTSYVATGRVLTVTSAAAVLGADLEDGDGRQIASATVIVQPLKNVSRLVR